MSTTVSLSLLPILKTIFCSVSKHLFQAARKICSNYESSKQAKLGNQVKY